MVASGAEEAEAAHRTLAELSGSELLARELRRLERQAAPEPIVLGTNRGTNMIADLWQERKQPGFTLIAVILLALSIAANGVIFFARQCVVVAAPAAGGQAARDRRRFSSPQSLDDFAGIYTSLPDINCS